MIDQTIQEIEARIHSAKHLSFVQRKELQSLVADLKEEVLRLSQTHQEDADSIVRFARLTADEGLKEKTNPKLLKIAVDGVRASVEKFEKTHPGLTLTVNGISTFFSNIGI